MDKKYHSYVINIMIKGFNIRLILILGVLPVVVDIVDMKKFQKKIITDGMVEFLIYQNI